MDKQKLDYFQKLLLARREELLKELDYLKHGEFKETTKEATGENSSYNFHMADQGTDAMEREKAYYFANREGRLLYHIDQALDRVQNGTYGACHHCSKPISQERLEAVPHARLCIACKMNEENGIGVP